MNKKIITIISVLALVTLLGCFLYFKSNKAAKNEEIGPVENIKEEIELNKAERHIRGGEATRKKYKHDKETGEN